MSFARRLVFCVLAVVAMSLLSALVWDRSDQASVEPNPAPGAARTAARP